MNHLAGLRACKGSRHSRRLMPAVARAGITGLVLVVCCSPVGAAEITTNGSGGGPWSDPATWRGKVAPVSDDDVVIRKGDQVVFDRNDDGKVTCQKVLIDPKGSLSFKTRAGKVICCLANGIEAYGPINMDGSKSADDFLELRLVGDTAAKRTIKLLKNAALLARGRADLADGRHNVALTSPRPEKQKEDVVAVLDAGPVSMVDLQRIDVASVYVKALEIDSTGSKPNERVNIVQNSFTGHGRVFCQRCDTPVISKNTFTFVGNKQHDVRALYVTECPLPEVRDNTMRGDYSYGLAIGLAQDGTFSGNTIEGCRFGIHLSSGKGSSLNNNTIKGCEIAFDLHFTELATLAENSVDGARIAVRAVHSTAQFRTLQVSNLAKDGLAVLHTVEGARPASGVLTLINCNIAASQVKLEKLPDKTDQPPLVSAMCYLVVGVKDAPADTEVEVRTANAKLPPDSADLNVRNSPAPVVKDSTPVPVSAGSPEMFAPLVVQSWAIGNDGKPLAAPEYTVRVQAAADKPDAPRKVLKSLTVRPADDWFRPKPQEGKPMVEVSLK